MSCVLLSATEEWDVRARIFGQLRVIICLLKPRLYSRRTVTSEREEETRFLVHKYVSLFFDLSYALYVLSVYVLCSQYVWILIHTYIRRNGVAVRLRQKQDNL